MKMKRSLKSRGSDFAVVFLCLFLSFASLFLFWKDVNRTLSKIGEIPIGTITFKYKVAQRKFIDRLIWDRLQKESYVYNGDTIRTANLSEATIRFTDDNIITLDGNSIAQIFLDSDGSASVDFSGGGIRIDSSNSSSGISISSGGTNFKIESGSVMAATYALDSDDFAGSMGTSGKIPGGSSDSDSPGTLSFEVISGSASVKDSETGKIVNLTLGDGGSISGNGGIKESGITVVSPLQNARFNNYEEGLFSVPFNIVKNEKIPDFSAILEISETKDFKKLREKVSFKGLNQINIDLPEGVWYWRIITDSPDLGQKTISGKFTVVSISNPVLVVPEDKAVYSYRTVKPSIRFVWEGNRYASWYLLEVFEEQNMDIPVVSRRVSGTSVIIDEFDKGSYFWRITPVYSDNDNALEVDSGFCSFSVNDNKELDPPKLTSHPSGSFININPENDAGENSILFTWENDGEVKEYVFRILAPEDGKILKEVTVNENFINVNLADYGITEGTYYWQIAKKDEAGNICSESEKRKFTARKGGFDFYLTFPPDNYGIAETLIYDMRFAWKNNTKAPILFEVAGDENFDKILISKIQAEDVSGLEKIALKAGSYWWRIKSLDSDGNKEMELVSDSGSFRVLPPLLAPSVIFPLQGEVIPVAEGELTEFVWQAVPGADYYNFALYSSSSVEPVQEFKMLADTRVNVDLSNLIKGQYRYTVQAFSLESENQTRRTGLISEVYFSVYPIIPIELISPLSGSKIDGIEAVLNPGVLIWNSEDTLSAKRFILSKSPAGIPKGHNLSIRKPEDIILEINSPEERIQLPPLWEGVYYWTVTGINTVGYDLTPRTAYRFEVLPIPKLAAPDFVSPENKTVFDIYYLMNSTLCSVKWAPVEDATSYNVFLYRIEGNEKNMILEEHIENSSSPEYLLPDFTELGEGNFEFSVEAVQFTSGNLLLRNGNPGVLSFSIELPKIETLNLKTNGEMYGN